MLGEKEEKREERGKRKWEGRERREDMEERGDMRVGPTTKWTPHHHLIAIFTLFYHFNGISHGMG